MGIPEGTIPDSVKFPPMSASTGEELADVNIYIDTALSNRPDLKRYREALEAAKYTLYSRWGAFSPVVTANGGLSWWRNKTSNDGRFGNRYEGSNHWDTVDQSSQGTYGISVSWTLFDGTQRFTRVREAQALLAQSEYTLANQWITVVQQVRSAYDNYIQHAKQAVLYQKTLGLVTKQRDLVEEEYKAGNTELTRLNEAQTDLVRADTNLVSALINVQNAKAQLEAATSSR
jgi:outer membrane protein TolC